LPGNHESHQGRNKKGGGRALSRLKLPGLPSVLHLGSDTSAQRRRRWLMLGLEFVAGLVVASALLTGLVVWRISSGEISLDFLAGPIERAVNSNFEGYRISIGGAVLEQAEEDGSISFRLRDLAFRDDNDILLAEAPRAAIGISPLDLLVGEISPTSIDLIGPRLVVLMRRDGRVEIDIAREQQEPGSGSARVQTEPVSDPDQDNEADEPPLTVADNNGVPVSTVTDIKFLLGFSDEEGGQGFLGALNRVGILNADLIFIHEKLGVRWEIQQGNLALIRDGAGIRYEASADVTGNTGDWSLRLTGDVSDPGEGLRVSINVQDFIPRQAASLIEGLGGLSMLDLPISASGVSIIDDNSRVRSFDLTARFGAGMLRLGEESDRGFVIDKGAIELSYNASENLIQLMPSRFDFNDDYVTFSGTINPPVTNPESQPGSAFWEFDLKGDEGSFTAQGVDMPLQVDAARILGRYDAQNGEIWFDQAEMRAQGVSIAANGRVKAAERSPEIELFAKFSPMAVDVLKQIWPHLLAQDAREWFFENVYEGTITDLAVVVDFPGGLIADLEEWAPIPQESFDLAFGFRGVTAEYFWALPNIENGLGRGKMKGGRFSADIIGGTIPVASGAIVENVTGSIEIPNVTDEPAIAYIRAVGSGTTAALLELLNYAPLEYADDVGLNPADIGGTSTLELDISVPLLREVTYEEVNLAARAEINDFSVPDLFGGQDVENGELILRVLPTRVEAAGEMMLSGVPARVNWRRSFGDPGGGNLSLRMRLDETGRKIFDVDLDFLRGPVEVEIVPDSLGARNPELGFLIDLTDASLTYPDLGWDKPAGVASDARFNLVSLADGSSQLNDFALVGSGTNIAGDLVVDNDGRILSAAFPQFALNAGDDLSLNVHRGNDDVLNVVVRGESFNGSGIVQGMFDDAGPASPSDGSVINLDAVIARVSGNSGSEITNVTAQVIQKDGRTSYLTVDGLAEGENLTIRITPSADGNSRDLNIESGNAGAVLRFAGLYSNVQGGDMIMRANLPNDSSAAVNGQLVMRAFRLVDDRIARRIVSTDPRTSNRQSSAQGDYFQRLNMPFTRQNGVLTIGESYINGPVVGATLRGQVDFNRDTINLAGTYVPLYALNNLLSNVPVVGQILTGGRNEGLLAVTFAIQGSLSNSRVIVNPISAVAPGLLRKLFDFGPSPQRPAIDPPSTIDSDR
jgi:AsmA-like protein/uncharacterized protein DUF3971